LEKRPRHTQKRDGNTEVTERRTQRAQRRERRGHRGREMNLSLPRAGAGVKAAASRRTPREATQEPTPRGEVGHCKSKRSPRKVLRPEGLSYRGGARREEKGERRKERRKTKQKKGW
jgi:hypothetical protein